jgi:RNA polymerase sigma-70 factor (ECF subfamily)
MTEPQSATEIYQRWRSGDERAAQQLFALYARRLSGLAQANISQRLARRIDGEDVVQSVFRTFFRRGAVGEFSINSEVDIWRLLVKITVRKTRTQARRHTSERRDIAAESPATAPDWLLEAMDQDPNPADAAEIVDLMQAILRGLPETHGQILAMRLAGYSRTDIATELGLSRQTVWRVLSLLQDRVLALQ